MKIMISLKTYSSLPLAAAEKEGEEEEFSVKARYNAEREREKNAGREGEDRHLLQVQLCNCSSHWKLAKDGVVVVGEDATGENYATDALKRKTEGWVWIAHSTGYLAPAPFRFNLNGPQCGLMLGSPQQTARNWSPALIKTLKELPSLSLSLSLNTLRI